MGLEFVNETAEGFFRELQERRNAAVDTLMAALTQNDPMGTKRRKIDLHDDIPKTVTILAPAIQDHEAVDHLCVLASPRTNMKLAVEFTSEVLCYLRAGAWAYTAPESPQKLHIPRDTRRLAGCPNVAWNKQRQCWWVKIVDDDGRERHKCFKPKHSDIAELAEQYSAEKAEEAQEFWDRTNRKPAGGKAKVANDSVDS